MSDAYDRALYTLARSRGRYRSTGPRTPSASFLALLALLRDSDRDGITVGAAARKADVDQGTTSLVLSRMTRMGVAVDEVFADMPDHRTRHGYWITDLGREVATELLDQRKCTQE